MSSAAPLRLPRALVLAGGADAIGAASHVLGGGPVHPAGALAALPALLALAWPLTGRQRGWLAILGVQLVGQQVAHLLLGWGAEPAPHSALPADAWFYGHVAAALAVPTWLRCGERRTWVAARRVAAAVAASWRRLLARIARQPAVPVRRAPAPVAGVPRRRHHHLRHSVVRRGPPLPA